MRLFLTILSVFVLSNCFAKTIVVGKDQLITSLKKGIEAASDNDTILLKSGVYKEGNIVLNKSVKLIGIDYPVLDGENKFEILTVSGTKIIIKGIHFKNSGFSSMNDYASINLVDATYVVIENNKIDNAFFAIHIANTQNSVVRNNVIKGEAKSEQSAGNGIHLWKCDSMVVKDNNITGHRDGIYFEFVTNSFITGNDSYKNVRYGLHFMFSNKNSYLKNIFKENGAGVAVMYSHHVLMLANTFEQNWGSNAYGLLLKEINDATIFRNVFTKNTVSVLMETTNRINVEKNSFNNNGWALKISASCTDNDVYQNNFQGNTFDVATNGSLMLNRFKNNYWDKYEGYDLNKDAVGDVPFHPVSMYSMVVESNPNSLILLRSFIVSLLDKAEKAIPGLTPEFLIDESPLMKAMRL